MTIYTVNRLANMYKQAKWEEAIITARDPFRDDMMCIFLIYERVNINVAKTFTVLVIF